MKIACLGWGSLIWRPESLLIRKQWFHDGPFLPIEFTRQSNDGRLTLVLTKSTKPVRTLWALMATDSLEQAKMSLLSREKIPKSKLDIMIASVTATEKTADNTKSIIQNWAKNLDLDAVVWTNLNSKFQNKDKRAPTIEEALNYLKSLDNNARKNAEEYIRKAPLQIDTEYRRMFDSELGWTFIE